MSDGGGQRQHTHDDAPAAPSSPPFRFEAFADGASAQAAFEALYPPDSSIEPALQRLVDMGAHCKRVSPQLVACRYIETGSLAGFCWHVALETESEKAIRRVGIDLAMLGV